MPSNIKLWVQHTIPGFLYLVTIFFLVLIGFNIHCLHFLENKVIEPYLPYISIIIIIISSILGDIAYKGMENIISIIHKEYQYNASLELEFIDSVKSEFLINRRNDLYTILVFFRHMIVGTSFLLTVIVIWLICSDKSQIIFPIDIVCIVFVVLFYLTYRFQKKSHNAFQKGVNEKYNLKHPLSEKEIKWPYFFLLFLHITIFIIGLTLYI